MLITLSILSAIWADKGEKFVSFSESANSNRTWKYQTVDKAAHKPINRKEFAKV